jgi:hypothetical protein
MAEAGIEAAAKKRCAAPGCDAVRKSADARGSGISEFIIVHYHSSRSFGTKRQVT